MSRQCVKTGCERPAYGVYCGECRKAGNAARLRLVEHPTGWRHHLRQEAARLRRLEARALEYEREAGRHEAEARAAYEGARRVRLKAGQPPVPGALEARAADLVAQADAIKEAAPVRRFNAAERFYLCETFKSGRIVILGGGRWHFGDFNAAYHAASEPHELEDGSSILPGVCASRRVLQAGDDVCALDTSVRLIVRTEGYHA